MLFFVEAVLKLIAFRTVSVVSLFGTMIGYWAPLKNIIRWLLGYELVVGKEVDI